MKHNETNDSAQPTSAQPAWDGVEKRKDDSAFSDLRKSDRRAPATPAKHCVAHVRTSTEQAFPVSECVSCVAAPQSAEPPNEVMDMLASNDAEADFCVCDYRPRIPCSEHPDRSPWIEVKSRNDMPDGSTPVWMFIRGVGERQGFATRLFQKPWKVSDEDWYGERNLDFGQVAAYVNLGEIAYKKPAAVPQAATQPTPREPLKEDLRKMRRAEFVYDAARLAAIAAQAPIVPVPWREREQAFRAQFLDVIDKQCGPDRSTSPEELHGTWVEAYLKMGWVYGEKYDREKKIHPDMVPYAELGQLERDKDAVFVALCEIARQWLYARSSADTQGEKK